MPRGRYGCGGGGKVTKPLVRKTPFAGRKRPGRLYPPKADPARKRGQGDIEMSGSACADAGKENQWISTPERWSNMAMATKRAVPMAAHTASSTKSFMEFPLPQTTIPDDAGQAPESGVGAGTANPERPRPPWSPGRPVPIGGIDKGSRPLPERANRKSRGTPGFAPGRKERCRRNIRRRYR